MYCSNLSCKFSRQTQKKLVGFSHYGHFRAQGYPKFEFKKTYQVDINFPVGTSEKTYGLFIYKTKTCLRGKTLFCLGI
jgi:hypothetical protein